MLHVIPEMIEKPPVTSSVVLINEPSSYRIHPQVLAGAASAIGLASLPNHYGEKILLFPFLPLFLSFVK